MTQSAERTFYTETDSTLVHRNGQPIEVLRAIRHADNAHDWDVLPMFRVAFPDGAEVECWRDEIRPLSDAWLRKVGASQHAEGRVR